jgi:hypothetical protein
MDQHTVPDENKLRRKQTQIQTNSGVEQRLQNRIFSSLNRMTQLIEDSCRIVIGLEYL